MFFGLISNHLISHPNIWIRGSAERFIAYISDPANKILSAAEVYCLVRPEVKLIKKHQAGGSLAAVTLFDKDQNNQWQMKRDRH
jgi:hypothetical protein